MKSFLFLTFLIMIFYGCAPLKNHEMVFSESSLKYSSFFYSTREDIQDLQTERLYFLLRECDNFEARTLSYMYSILFGADLPPHPTLVAQKLKSSIRDQFPKMNQRNVRKVSQSMNQVYERTLEFFFNKTREAVLEDWQYIENTLEPHDNEESPEYVQVFIEEVQEQLKLVEDLIQPFRGTCEKSEVPSMGGVTFLIGMNMFEMANHLHSRNLITRKEFLDWAQNERLIKTLLQEDVESLEGYLFPGSYTLLKGDRAPDLLAQMVRRFLKAYDSVKKDSGLTRHQVVILASMIEKEAVVDREKPIIASVFFNRLRKGMKLQSDPTVAYGVLRDTGLKPVPLKKKHLSSQNPYNTYTVGKLPRGPISNPGLASISAVFNPARTPYIFFVSQNGRTHAFSVTYEEHKKNVSSYRNRIKTNTGT